jgi:hypothetical protein
LERRLDTKLVQNPHHLAKRSKMTSKTEDVYVVLYALKFDFN